MDKNKILLTFSLILTLTISDAETFTIKHNSCSSQPLTYKVIRSKQPIKIVNYTYDNKGVSIESGVVSEFSEKQINLDNYTGKVQIIITKSITSDGNDYLDEYFLNQKVYCVTTLENKKCYALPEDLSSSSKPSNYFGIQWVCPNKSKIQSTKIAASHVSKKIGLDKDAIVVAGTPLTPMYESNLKTSK